MDAAKDKSLYINTIGCQMNVYDSSRIEDVMKPLGYTMTDSVEKADMIVVNTCSVREKAEQKAFSFLGRLASLKKKKPDLIICVGGCVAQQEGKKIVRRVPHIDIIFGTHAVNRLPQLVRHVTETESRIVDVELTETIDEFTPDSGYSEAGTATGFVTIMRGCDNFCTYCVVPYVRGREISRHPDRIIEEIENRVKSGIREVTLLGQNVNSYGKNQGLCTFPELLARVNKIDGLQRIRFTTSHPKDFSNELIDSYKDLDKLCNHIHLPVQSGSNNILAKMNRKYTREQYLDRLDRLRKVCPDIAITSDMIAGFPGETEADFQETLSLIKEVEFDGLFAFAYSDRPNAKATGFSDKVDDQVKMARLQELLELQKYYTRKKNERFVNKTVSVLIEGLSKKQDFYPDSDGKEEWTGRIPENKVVNFNYIDTSGISSKMKPFAGKTINVVIEKALSHSLRGKPAVSGSPVIQEGENNHAA